MFHFTLIASKSVTTGLLDCIYMNLRYTSLPVYQVCALHCIALSRICNPASWAASVAQFLEQGPRNPVVRGLNPT